MNPSGVTGGYGWMLLESLLVLVGVCLLAWVLLKWLSGLGVGVSGKHVRVLERTPIDPRRALVLVEVGGRTLLLGTGDGAAPSLIAELEPGSVSASRAAVVAPGAGSPAVSRRFADVLEALGVRGGAKGAGPVDSPGGEGAP